MRRSGGPRILPVVPVMVSLAAPVAYGGGYVLQAERVQPLRRAVRRARRQSAGRIVVMDALTVCVELDSPDPEDVLRIARKLGHAPEWREDCDVAAYPPGTGWWVAFLEPPALGVEEALDAAGLGTHVIRHRETGVEVCVSRWTVDDAQALRELLATPERAVRSVQEVGGCS